MAKYFFGFYLTFISTWSLCQPQVIQNTRTDLHVPLTRMKISLIPPANFQLLPNDSGFFRTGSNTASGGDQIRVLKLFIDFSQIKRPLIDSAGAIAMDVTINNYEGIYIRKAETIEGRTFTSLTLGFGNKAYSYVIVGVTQSAASESALKRSVQSAYVDTFGYEATNSSMLSKRSAGALNRFQTKFESRFRIDLSGTAFRQAEIITDNHTIYTLDGAYPPIIDDKSFIEIQYIAATVSEPSHVDYAKDILTNRPGIRQASNLQDTTVRIDSLPGVDLVADAINVETSSPVKVYQSTLFGDGGVYIITGLSYMNQISAIDLFKRVAKTFRRTK